MPKHLNLHEQETRRLRNQLLGGRPRATPRFNLSEGELPTGYLNIMNAWQLGEDDLELIRAVWEECLEELPIVLSGVNTPCKVWVGPQGKGPWVRSDSRSRTLGYGLYWLGGEGNFHVRTHALAWRLAGNPSPSLDPRTKLKTRSGKYNTMDISHRCNNRRCCNPAHLHLETHAENVAYVKKSKQREAMEQAADLAAQGHQPTQVTQLPQELAIQDDTEGFLHRWAGLS